MRDIVREADEILERAKKNLHKDKHLAPVAFVLHDRGMDVIALQLGTERQKRMAYAAVSWHCRQLRAYAAILVNEAWFTTTEPPQPHERKRSVEELIEEAERDVPPSRDPQRREGIVVSVIGPGIKPRVRLVPFHRRAGEIVFEGEDKWIDAGVAMLKPWWDAEPTRQ